MLKKIFTYTCACLGVLLTFYCAATPKEPAHAASLLSRQALLFTENRGQVADAAGRLRPDVLFTAYSSGAKLFLTANGIYYQFTHTAENGKLSEVPMEAHVPVETYRFSLTLDGANLHPKVRREQPHAYTEHFYLAHCPNGIINVHTYEKVVYEEVYPHIDWVLYSEGAHLKYDFVVKPGGDPAQIRLRVQDAQQATIATSGELVMKTSLGTVKEKAPISFAAGKEVPTHFKQYDDGTFGFDVSALPGETLVIDPSVTWATYYGSSAQDLANGCTTDASGNVYLSGTTFSTTGLASGGFQSTSGGDYDNFLVKFDAAGNRIWATYYGGAANDQNNGCVTDASGNVYLAGFTNSSTAIASGGFQNTYGGGQDAFLAKFTSAGVRIWGTYYGGSGVDNTFVNNCCAIDAAGNVYLCGQTTSTTGMASGGFQNTFGGLADAFLVKFDAAGNRLWGTYYGGAGNDNAYSCIADPANNVYLVGSTTSASGMASGGFQTTFGGSTDAYLVKFDANGARQWATYCGGTGDDYSSGVTADASGIVYITGYTNSTTNIASGGFQNTFAGATDAFLVKVSATGARLWGTYYGDSGAERGFGGCVTDVLGNVYLTGWSTSTANIASGGFQMSNAGSADAFAVKFDAAGNRLWGTFYGGPGADQPYDCFMDAAGILYIAGYTASTSGMASGGFQNTFGGNSDGFLVKITDVIIPAITTSALSASAYCVGSAINVPFTITGTFNAGNVFTAQLSDASGSFATPTNIGTLTGTTAGTISATIPVGTTPGAGYRIRVVSSNPAITGSDNGTNITINAAVTPSVTIAANPTGAICSGTPVTFTATPVNGGTPPTLYQWKKGATNVGANSATYTDAGLINGDVITLVMTSSLACAGTAPVTSNAITMTVNPPVTPTISITAAPGTTVCAGTSVTFTATGTNLGGAPTYQWKVNGANVGTNSPNYTTTTLTNGSTVTCTVTGNAPCTTTAPVTSNTITMTIDPTVVPTIAITANPGNTICAGTSVTFTATITNGGATPTYVWKKGATTVGTNSATYTDNGLINGDVITCQVTSNASCASTTPTTSNAITITVNPTLTPTASIVVAPSNIVCPGVLVTFTATITNGGTTPVYQWKRNGVNIGTNSSVFSSATLSNNDVITCELTSNAPCTSVPTVVSNGITMSIGQMVNPTVAINTSPGNSICAGTPVTFTCTTSNAGATPVYQWRRNGITVSTSSTYSSNSLVHGDVITCIMGSSIACVSNPIANSAPVVMSVNYPYTPSVTILASPGTTINPGTTVSFYATVTGNGGAYTYQWIKNGGDIPGAISNVYVTNALNNNDVISCVVNRNAACNGHEASSNDLLIKMNRTNVGSTQQGTEIILFPNPNQGSFRLKGAAGTAKQVDLDIVNTLGQSVYHALLPVSNGQLDQQITLKEGIAGGTYVLRLRLADSQSAIRFVITR